MTEHAVRVWWLGTGSIDARALERIRACLERTFAMTVLLEPVAGRPDAFDKRRGQHSSSRMLSWIAARLPDDGTKGLGLTDLDLFMPVLTFVFGEAQLGGRAAIASSARLGGALADTGTPLARLAKEAAHELGHTLGLLHCDRPSCLMSRSASLADVDRKGAELCHDCQLRLFDLQRPLAGVERPLAGQSQDSASPSRDVGRDGVGGR